MKRIIIINQYGATPDVPGATKHYDMGHYFSKKDKYKVEYWLSGLNHKTGKNHDSLGLLKLQSKQTINNNFKVVRIKGFAYGKNLILRQLSIIFFEIITAIKILFSRNISTVIINTPPVGFINIIATKLRNKKLIVDVEDLWPMFLVDMGMDNKIAERYMNFCNKISYKLADQISTVSLGMYNYVGQVIGNDYKKIWISPLGVNLKEFTNTKINCELIENKEWKNSFKIIYLGAHGRANDLISVLETIFEFNKLNKNNTKQKDISFIFIGDGDHKDEIMKKAQELKLSNVFFEGPVPGSMVSEYLKHADICLTNLQKIESFKLVRPNKLFQYMALGKPIVSGIWGEFREIIEEQGAGVYIDFTDDRKAAKSLFNLIYDDNLLKNMSRRGVSYIRENGDREKIFSEYFRRIDGMEGKS